MMKNLIILLILFATTFSFAQTKSSYYEKNISKKEALAKVKMYDRYLLSINYKLESETKKSDYDYTKNWSIANNGLSLSATVRYEFSTDKLTVTMSDPKISTATDTLALTADSENATIKTIYDTVHKMLVDLVFDYVSGNESKNNIQRKTN